MAGPLKMKGSPMQRNFGTGSPLRDDKKKTISGLTKEEIAKRELKHKRTHWNLYERSFKDEKGRMVGLGKYVGPKKK